MRKLMLVLAGFASLAVAACNTVEGAGEDIQAAGSAVERTAEEVKTGN
jgi:predicted small secreted protein